jgi:hypothetical protein
MVLNSLVYIAALIIVVILIIVALRFLFQVIAIAPIAYGAEQADTTQKEVDTVTKQVNDTEITVTCTSNIPNLVSCD